MGASGPWWGVGAPGGAAGCWTVLLPLGAAGIQVPGPEVLQQDRLVLPEPLPILLVFVPRTLLVTWVFQQTTRDTKHSAFLKIIRFIKNLKFIPKFFN